MPRVCYRMVEGIDPNQHVCPQRQHFAKQLWPAFAIAYCEVLPTGPYGLFFIPHALLGSLRFSGIWDLSADRLRSACSPFAAHLHPSQRRHHWLLHYF